MSNSRKVRISQKFSVAGHDSCKFLLKNNFRSLIEKGDVIEQVAQIWRVVETSVGIKAKPPIHFYDRDSNKELASWSEEGGGIIELE